jgi:hypothetical protein
MRTYLVGIVVATIASGSWLAAQTNVGSAAFEKIRAEGYDRSQASDVFEMLTVEIGPRLTASPAQKRASEWARERLAKNGASSARLEPWTFGRGWALDQLTVEMIEPRYLPLVAYADGWSPSTAGTLQAAPVFVGGKAAAELQAMAPQLKGAIVMAQPMMSNFVRKDRPQPSDERYVANSAAYATSVGRGRQPAPRGETPAQAAARVLRDAAPGVVIRPSVGEHGTVFVTGRDGGPGAPPAITLSGEHYNMIARMLERKQPVTLRVSVKATYYDADGGNAYNVIAELPGSDPAVRDEIVMIGAHIDSWHTGVGATDNADGSATMIEAMRILKASGVNLRRTVRVALWSGEEQGLLGSRAWVQQHLAGDANRVERERFNVYFNMDNGYGPVYGFYMQNRADLRSLFDNWLEPLKAVGARRNVAEGVGSTDHLSFIDAGVPGFNPIQEYLNYDIRTHHTNMDTLERLDQKDLKQSAVAMAWFAYQAANAPQKIARVQP